MGVLYNFEVHTPYRPFFSGWVEAVSLSLVDGEIGVYANHSPFTAPVAPGILRIRNKDGQWKSAFVSGGILEVKSHKTVLITDSAEWPEEIDRERAIAAAREAQESLESAAFKFEIDKAREKLCHSQFRLKASQIRD
jgi:F-type H+-transporting ATPase subunit epsilon